MLITQRHWQKFTTFEAQFRRAAADLAERVGEPGLEKLTVSPRQFERWYSGRVKTEPYPDACRVLEHMFGYQVGQLLAPLAPGSDVLLPADMWPAPRAALSASQPVVLAGGPQELAALGEQGSVAPHDWPLWFGGRVPQLVALVDSWHGSPAELGRLQDLLHQEMLMFDAAAPGDQGLNSAVHALSRRQALVSLAALPAAFTAFSAASASAHASGAATGLFLSRCAASLAACWHLLRGSNLAAVEQIVPGYLLPLEGVARQESKYQQAAALLACQAHRVCGIVALHRSGLKVSEWHCARALQYATIAADPSGRAAALTSLASRYFYLGDPARAAHVYEQVLGLEDGLSPLQRSRAYAEVSVVYGQVRREREALRAVGLAEQAYPGEPEHDPSFLYAEFTPASLTLERGLAYVALAEQYPQHGHQQRAEAVFAWIDAQAAAGAPERIRFEIVNHQARTAVLCNDLDAFESYIGRAVEGVALLGSRQRRQEMHNAWQYALARWPHERRLAAVGERLRLTAAGSG